MFIFSRSLQFRVRVSSCFRRASSGPFNRVAYSQFAKLATYPQRPRRQYVCKVEAEDPHNYLKGVYFPINIRNTFKDGRYLVLQKLGWGGYATVWLARDKLRDCNVALKIIRKDIGTHEVGIMRHLRDSSIAQTNHAHPGRKFLAQLLDEFDVSATHTCLVLEIMGRSIASRAEEFIGGRLPGNMARQVSHQVALGLDYLWKCGVAHGDLYGGNVLFAAPTISKLPEHQLQSYLGEPELGAVQRLDGEGLYDPSVPQYLVRPTTFRGCDTEIRIIDFGAAFFHDNPPIKLSTPVHMRAPEALFNQPLSASVDLWSMGCLIFETITGRSFIGSMLADRFSALEEIQSRVGPPPSDWMQQADDALQQFLNKSSLRRIRLDQYLRYAYDQDDAALIEEDDDDYPIEQYEKAKPDFTDRELDSLSLTLSEVLRYDPTSRKIPDDLLRSPWFMGIQ